MIKDLEQKYKVNWEENPLLTKINTKELIVLAYKQENLLYLKQSIARADFDSIFPDYVKHQLGYAGEIAFNKQPFEIFELTFKMMDELNLIYTKEDLFYLFLNNSDNRVKLTVFQKMLSLPKEEFTENFIDNLFKNSISQKNYLNLDILRNLEETKDQFIHGTNKKGNILISALRSGVDAPKSYETIQWLLDEGIKWESNTPQNIFISFNYFVNEWVNYVNNSVFQNKATDSMENPIKIAYTLFNIDNNLMSNALNFLDKRLNQSNHKKKPEDIIRFNELQQAYLESVVNKNDALTKKIKI